MRASSSSEAVVREGEVVMIFLGMGMAYAVRVERGRVLQMRFGALRHEFLIGKPFGSRVSATKGFVHVLRPTPELWTLTLPHRTQILYTPDVSIVLLWLELRPGGVLAEAGTGSGALSHAIARAVAPSGHLYTFDVEQSRVSAAREELDQHGFGSIVTVTCRDVCAEGLGLERQLDAAFLDLPRPWEALAHLRPAFKSSGGLFCSFSPCIEQVQRTCQALQSHGYVSIQTVECIPRNYKVCETSLECVKPEIPATKRLSMLLSPAQQPTHTGYLTSAIAPPCPSSAEP